MTFEPAGTRHAVTNHWMSPKVIIVMSLALRVPTWPPSEVWGGSINEWRSMNCCVTPDLRETR